MVDKEAIPIIQMMKFRCLAAKNFKKKILHMLTSI